MATVNGSPEHFQQVVTAHVVGPWGTCRCGVRVGVGPAAYRAHIARVWRPHALPDGWMGHSERKRIVDTVRAKMPEFTADDLSHDTVNGFTIDGMPWEEWLDAMTMD